MERLSSGTKRLFWTSVDVAVLAEVQAASSCHVVMEQEVEILHLIFYPLHTSPSKLGSEF